MPYDSKEVANYLLDLADRDQKRDVSPMKLLKLVYIAHGWHLALANEPLINEHVEAWKYGPVVPRLYHEFKDFGSQPITRRAKRLRQTATGEFVAEEPVLSPDKDQAAANAAAVIERTWKLHKDFTAIQLSNMTHQKDAPWDRTMKMPEAKKIMNIDMCNEEIKKWYVEQLGKAS